MGNMDNKAELLHNKQERKKDIYNFKCKKCGATVKKEKQACKPKKIKK